MRVINTRLYAMAGGITVIVFLLGLMLGVTIEGERVKYLEARDQEQEINFNSLQLQYLYLSSLEDTNSCGAFLSTLDNYIKGTEEARGRLEKYLEKSDLYEDDFKLLKREYIISQMNYWIMARKTKVMCDADFATVLYFFSKKCDECENQGFVLDYLKLRFGERLLIFAIDSDFSDEPMVSILTRTYNITEMPTVVVEGDKLVGFQSKDTLIQKLCGLYDMPVEGCV